MCDEYEIREWHPEARKLLKKAGRDAGDVIDKYDLWDVCEEICTMGLNVMVFSPRVEERGFLYVDTKRFSVR